MKKQNPTSWKKYKPGMKDSYGRTIKTIYYLAKNGILYETTEGEVYRNIQTKKSPNAERALSIAQNLLVRIQTQLPDSKIHAGKNLTYGALGLALSADDRTNILPMFKEAELYIESTLNEILHLRFVGTAIAIAMLTASPAAVYSLVGTVNDTHQILTAAFLGALGSLVSLLQRFKRVSIPKYSSWRFIIVHSGSRILIGTIFAVAFMLFHKAGLILNTVEGNLPLVYSFAFISGLSERFIPDVISKIEGKTATKTEETEQERRVAGRKKRSNNWKSI